MNGVSPDGIETLSLPTGLPMCDTQETARRWTAADGNDGIFFQGSMKVLNALFLPSL